MSKQTIVGLVEKIKINNHVVIARIDTGAKYNSICRVLVNKCKLNHINKTVRVRSSLGKQKRQVVEGTLKIKNRKIKTRFNITDRTHMKYQVLIGWNTLKNGFIVDPSKGDKN